VPTVDKSKITGTFTVAAHNEAEARKKATDAFFKKYYPNMTVKYDITPGLDNYFLKLQAQIAGGSSPDYMLMHETRALAYSAQGLLLPLDDLQKANPMPGKPEDYAGLEAAKYKGKSYVWPATFANYAILYNKDLFDKVGVPYPKDEWTWQDLLDTGKKFTKSPDTWGLSGMVDDPGWLAGWYPLLKAHGGETFDEMDTQCLLNTPEGVQTFDFLRELWCNKVHPTPAAAKQVSGYAMFLEGRVAMCYFYTGFVSDVMANRKGGFKLGLVALPKGPKGRFIRIGGSSYAIPKGSKYPDIAWELMRYQLGDPEGAQLGYDDKAGTAKVDFFLKYYAPQGDAATMLPEWKTVAVDQAMKYGIFVRYSKIGTPFSPMVAAEAAPLADCSKAAADVVKTVTDKANQMIKEFK
jgi:multiple sugar transport system substrate-binding protein